MDANYVQQRIIAAANQYGVPVPLALGVGRQESSFNPYVSDSSAGAMGPMQLVPATAKSLGVDPRNVDQNIDGGVRYLKQQLDAFHGEPLLAAAAYNAGPGRVSAYLNGQGGLPLETRDYIQKVNAHMGGPNTGTQMSDASDLYSTAAQQPQMMQMQGQPSMLAAQARPSILARLLQSGLGGALGVPQQQAQVPQQGAGQGGGYDLGNRLQHAAAWMMARDNPAGAASMMDALNKPLLVQHYSTVSDALGNQYILNTRTGQLNSPKVQFNNAVRTSAGGVGGGGTDIPSALAASPVALKAQAEENAKEDVKKLSALEESASLARGDNAMLQNQVIPILQDPNTSQGALAEYRTDAKNIVKSLTGIDLGGVEGGRRLGEISARLAANNAKQMGVQRYAGPEIKMAQGSTISENQPQGTNLQAAKDYIGINNRTIAMYELAQEFKSRGLPLSGSTWKAAVDQVVKKHPTWTLDQSNISTSSPSGAASNGLPSGVKSIQVVPAQ